MSGLGEVVLQESCERNFVSGLDALLFGDRLACQFFELKAFCLVQRPIGKPFLVLARHAHREVIKLFTLLIHFREHSCRGRPVRIVNLGALLLQRIAIAMHVGIHVEQVAAR